MAEVNYKHGIVTAGLLNVRKSASMDSEIINVLNRGTEVKYVNVKKKEWVKVYLDNDKVGYCMSSFIK